MLACMDVWSLEHWVCARPFLSVTEGKKTMWDTLHYIQPSRSSAPHPINKQLWVGADEIEGRTGVDIRIDGAWFVRFSLVWKRKRARKSPIYEGHNFLQNNGKTSMSKSPKKSVGESIKINSKNREREGKSVGPLTNKNTSNQPERISK